MRVLVNYLCALKQRSGVGHYTAELFQAIQKHHPDIELDLFPAPVWEGWIRAGMGFFRKDAPRNGGSPGLGNTWKSMVKDEVKAGLRKGLGYLFADRVRRAPYDLHHEPNFLPFEVDAPTVATVHDLSVLKNPAWHPADRVREFETRFEKSLRHCVHFFADTEFVRQEMIQILGVKAEKITSTPLGVRDGLGPMSPLEVRAQLREMKLPSRYFLHVGTIEPRKNLLFLMRQYCSLPSQVREQYPLVLVGGQGWNAAETMEYYESEGRRKGVVLSGYIPDSKLVYLYNGALALLTASHYEGFGLPVIEMLACGGAVVASDIGAHAEITHGKGLLLPLQDEAAWRNAMIRLATDEEWGRKLRRGGREVVEHYSWEKCAQAVVGGYARALGRDASCQDSKSIRKAC